MSSWTGISETSAPGIFAAGDIAEYDSVIHDRRLRIEHWDVAFNQGKYAALNMLGKQQEYDVVPYFWSDLADWCSMEYVGPASRMGRGVDPGQPRRGPVHGVLREGRAAGGGAYGGPLGRSRRGRPAAQGEDRHLRHAGQDRGPAAAKSQTSDSAGAIVECASNPAHERQTINSQTFDDPGPMGLPAARPRGGAPDGRHAVAGRSRPDRQRLRGAAAAFPRGAEGDAAGGPGGQPPAHRLGGDAAAGGAGATRSGEEGVSARPTAA